jgi:hypothetical protein
MRKLTLFTLVMCSTLLFGQKQDYVWPIGYQSEGLGRASGETINFNYTPPRVDSVLGGVSTVKVSAGICDDSTGNLLFYTNGVKVCNRAGELLLNSDNITDCDPIHGCDFLQSSLVLPYPNHPNQYILFAHTYTIFNINGRSEYMVIPFKYSVIDMSVMQGRGSVIEKNTILINDSLMLGSITACRHANGRDWWVLINKHQSTLWYRVLVSPSGVRVVGTQDIGYMRVDQGRGQAVFSPDGRWFAIIEPSYLAPNYDNYIELFRFDRCSGLLTKKELLNIPQDTALAAGVIVSANSRFLYTCTRNSLHQFDLQASNVGSSKIKIAAYDRYRTIHGSPTPISHGQLAPNGKIYIASISTSDILHVIEAPDSLGLACNFRQHAIPLPTYNGAVPNYPNFRLGALVGSGCDTIVANSEVSEPMQGLKLFPNPVNQVLNIDLTLDNYQYHGSVVVVLYDVLGHSLKRHTVSDFSSIVQLDVSGLASGLYLVGLEVEGVVVKTEKVVVGNR